jgi:hypothetical protein
VTACGRAPRRIGAPSHRKSALADLRIMIQPRVNPRLVGDGPDWAAPSSFEARAFERFERVANSRIARAPQDDGAISEPERIPLELPPHVRVRSSRSQPSPFLSARSFAKAVIVI